MSTVPVAHYLRDLNADPTRMVYPFGAEQRASDIEARIEEAHTRGVLEGQAAAQAEYAVDLQRQLAERDQRFALERQVWADTQGRVLADLLTSAVFDLEQRICERVSTVLKAVLLAEVRQRAVDDLMTTLDQMLAKGEYAKITISGPEDLLASCRARFEGRDEAVSFVPGAGVDVSVAADETILETRIEAWRAAIQGERA